MPARRSAKLSSVDAAWLQMEDPTNLMMITGMIIFDEPLDYERFLATVEHRFVGRFPRFRQRIVRSRLGRPHWENDPTFDLAAHIHRIALPAPGDRHALEALVGDLMSMPLDFSKPLWQFHLVENREGRNALLIRLHHCIADGIALIQVMLSLTDTDADAPWPQSDTARKPKGWNPLAPITRPAKVALDVAQNLASATLRTGLSVAQDPEQLVNLARLGSETALTTGRLLLMSPDPQTIYKGKLGVTKRAAWSHPMPLSDIKMLGHAVGGTVNDVLLATAAGALRRYVIQRAEAG
ncbi:MAG: wax ester/triacylglycerol synthase domain-containing protein, partial [Anaerolineae bacterium]